MVSSAFVYNLIVVIARFVFYELGSGAFAFVWLFLDILADITYALDMLIRTRTGSLPSSSPKRQASSNRVFLSATSSRSANST